MNILLLSAGRRVELSKYIKQELSFENGKLYAADISYLAPAIYFADKFIKVPPVSSNNYVSYLINIVKKEKIDLIIPTIDTELLILAKNKNLIERKANTKVLISDVETIEKFNDKFKTANFFLKNGFKTPKIITEESIANGQVDYPLFIKPFDGSSSKNTFKINNKKELYFFKEYIDNPIIQEFIDGTEYTIDVMTDFKGKLLSVVPRVRIKTRGGEISKGLIIKDKTIIETIKKMVKKIKVCGPLTIQCIKNENGIYFIEINPRFGGGAPLGFKVGANSVNKLIRLLKGEELSYDESYDDNILALRYDDTIFLKDGSHEKY